MYFNRSRRGGFILRTLAVLALAACAGCDVAGIAATKLGGDDQVAAAYSGLKGQRVAILVWADEGVSMDHPRISPDVASGLHGKLQQAVEADADEVRKSTFVSTDEVLRFQDAHPESQSEPPEKIATQLPGTRLIYIEVASLSLHPNNSADLSKGEIVADVKVVAVANGKGTVVYENRNITGVYPASAPPEGMPGLDDEMVYHKSIDALTTEIAKLFITHAADTHE